MNPAEPNGPSAKLTEAIIGAAIDVHRELGPGLLESAYDACLAHELTNRGIAFERQVVLPLVYKGQRVDCGYRLDFLVQDEVVIETKACDQLAPIHEAQLLTYLRLSRKRVGLLINFNERVLKSGIRRRVL
ncbi:MAG: GxxExxY protein [Phycisphaerales bacterium]